MRVHSCVWSAQISTLRCIASLIEAGVSPIIPDGISCGADSPHESVGPTGRVFGESSRKGNLRDSILITRGAQ